MKDDIIKHLSRDPKLAAIIPKIEIPEVDTHNDIYLDLLDSIVSQQLSVKAAGTIFQRFLEIFDDLNPTPHRVLELDVEVLRGVVCHIKKRDISKILLHIGLTINVLKKIGSL